MGKLIEVKGQQVSEDTIVEALRKHVGFEEKEKFEPITIDGTTISVREGSSFPVAIQSRDFGDAGDREGYNLDERPYNILNTNNARKVIKAIQSAIDYIEGK